MLFIICSLLLLTHPGYILPMLMHTVVSNWYRLNHCYFEVFATHSLTEAKKESY